MESNPTPGVSVWSIEQTPLSLMGYGSGVKAKLPSQRREVLKKTMRVDFLRVLDPRDYMESMAGKWGAPNSLVSLDAVERCLGFPVHNWTTGSRTSMDEAVRHRVQDLRFLK